MLFSRSAKSRTNVHEARPLNLRFLYPKTDKAMHGEGYPDGATPNDYTGARLHERDARRLGAGWAGDGGTTGNAGGAAADPGYLVRDHRRQPGGACWDDAGRSYLAQSSVTVARKRRRLRFARSSASRRSSFARWRHRRPQWRALSRCFGTSRPPHWAHVCVGGGGGFGCRRRPIAWRIPPRSPEVAAVSIQCQFRFAPRCGHGPYLAWRNTAILLHWPRSGGRCLPERYPPDYRVDQRRSPANCQN
jgi:hypothetical protein